jgi:uncharacterized OB-fold protein
MKSASVPASPLVVLQRCEQCGRCTALAREFCAACGSHQVLPFAVSGRSVVWSVTCVHASPSVGEWTAAPYGIALVRLECGIKFMLRVPVGLTIGDCVDIERAGVEGVASLVNVHRGPSG